MAYAFLKQGEVVSTREREPNNTKRYRAHPGDELVPDDTPAVVLINSGAGLQANPGWAAYAASKFALRAFGDALRLEEGPGGLRVTSVHPGRVDSDMQRAVREHEGGEYESERYLTAESVASAVVGAVNSTPDAHITDITIRPMARPVS